MADKKKTGTKTAPSKTKKTTPSRFNPFRCAGSGLGMTILPPTKVFDIDGDQDESLLFNAARPGIIIVEKTDLSPSSLNDEIDIELIHPRDEMMNAHITLGESSHRVAISTGQVPRHFLHNGSDINLNISSPTDSVFGVLFIEE